MNCNQIKELLSDYIDHRLAVEAYDQISAHLNSCEECRAEYNHIMEIVNELNSLPETPLPKGIVFSLETLRNNTWDQRTAEQKAEAENRKHTEALQTEEMTESEKIAAEEEKVIDLEEKRIQKEGQRLTPTAEKNKIRKNGLSDEDIREAAKLFHMEQPLDPNIELITEEALKKEKLIRRNKVLKKISLAAAALVIAAGCYGVYQNSIEKLPSGQMQAIINDSSDQDHAEGAAIEPRSENTEDDTAITDSPQLQSNTTASDGYAGQETGTNNSTSNDNINAGASDKNQFTDNSNSKKNISTSEPLEGAVGDSQSNSNTGTEASADSGEAFDSGQSPLPASGSGGTAEDQTQPLPRSAPGTTSNSPETASIDAVSKNLEEAIAPYKSLIENGLRNVNYEIVSFNDSTNTLSLIIISDKNGNPINQELDLILTNGVAAPVSGYEAIVAQYWDYS